MRRFPPSRLRASASVAAALALAPALAEDALKPKPSPPPAAAGPSEIARYCAALAPNAAEARAVAQLRRLATLEEEVREQSEKLETRVDSAREWVTKRDAMLRAATDDVVAIYGKMAPETAAAALAEMDESVAAAVLAKLNARGAAAIMAEMQAEKAAKLSTLIAGALRADKS